MIGRFNKLTHPGNHCSRGLTLTVQDMANFGRLNLHNDITLGSHVYANLSEFLCGETVFVMVHLHWWTCLIHRQTLDSLRSAMSM